VKWSLTFSSHWQLAEPMHNNKNDKVRFIVIHWSKIFLPDYMTSHNIRINKNDTKSQKNDSMSMTISRLYSRNSLTRNTLMPHCRIICLCQCRIHTSVHSWWRPLASMNTNSNSAIRRQVLKWPRLLTCDLENLFNSEHSRNDCRDCVRWNRH